MEGIRLYRKLFRMTRRLPHESWSYYRRYLRENFEAHRDEDDPIRTRTMREKAQEDANWILKK